MLNRNARIFVSIHTEFKTVYQISEQKSTASHDSLVAVAFVFFS